MNNMTSIAEVADEDTTKENICSNTSEEVSEADKPSTHEFNSNPKCDESCAHHVSAAKCSESCTDNVHAPCGIEAELKSGELVVGRSIKTRVLQKINAGAFGEIHLGELLSNGQQVAVKLEYQNAQHPQLMSEGNVYRHLEGGPGIPRVHWFGLHEPLYNVMVMDLLGPSLQDLFAYCDRKFTLKTTLLLVDQMLEIVEFIHKKQYIYRDIKPDNFMMGVGESSNRVFVVDFGLAKKCMPQRYSMPNIGCHLVRPLVGTVRYASLSAHLGYEEGPRDDLEGLAYVWAYFLRGSLPWQGVLARRREEKFAIIRDLKKKTSPGQLFEGFPEEFMRFLDRIRSMRRDDHPDYKRIREIFRNLAERNEIVYDYEFDWVIKERETGESVKTVHPTIHSHSS